MAPGESPPGESVAPSQQKRCQPPLHCLFCRKRFSRDQFAAHETKELSLQLREFAANLAGPDRWNTPAWRLELPERPIDDFSQLRIAAWLDDPYCPVDASTTRVLGTLVEAIESAGGRVDTEARPGFTLEKVDTVFKTLFFAALSGEHSYEQIEELAAVEGDHPFDRARRSSAQRHREWLTNNERRMQIRERWREFFEGYDIILMPVQPRSAIPHDHSEPQWARTVEIGGVERPYLDLFGWTGPAGAGFLPSTVVPAGMGDDGLPIGVQVVGPYLHDITTIRAARLISKLCGGPPRPGAAL